EEEQIHAPDLAEFVKVSACTHCLEHRHHEHVGIRLGGVLQEALSPCGRTLRPDATDSFRWIEGRRNGLAQLLRGFYPWDDHAICTEVEHAFDRAGVEFGNSHQHNGIT